MWRPFDQATRRVGIEITSTRVNVVHAEAGARNVRVLGHGSAEVAPGTIRNGSVMNQAALVLAVKNALHAAGVATPVKAFISLPDGYASMLSVSVPPVPPAELPLLVQGELDHYGAINQGETTSAFLRVEPMRQAGSTEPITVAAFATSTRSIHGLVEALDLAGVGAVAAEPQPIALLRGGRATNPREPNLFILVGEQHSDFAFISEGAVRLYRRADVGLHAVTREDIVVGAGARDGATARQVRHPEALATEIRRSISFLQREDPGLTERLVVTLVTAPEYAVELAQELEALSDFPIAVPEAPVVAKAGQSEDGMSVGAYGLLVADETICKPIPPVSFVTGESDRVMARRRSLILAPYVLVAVLIVSLGGGAAWLMHGMAVKQREESATLRGKSATIRADLQQREEQRAGNALQYETKRKEGIPVGSVMDAIALSLPPSVGLDNVLINGPKDIAISGNAKSEDGLAAAMDALQRAQILRGVRIASIERGNERNSVVKFRMLADVPGGTK